MPIERIFIPVLGQALELTKDWTFQVHIEKRNAKLMSVLGHDYEDLIPHTRYDVEIEEPKREGFVGVKRLSNFRVEPPKKVLDGPLMATIKQGTTIYVDRIFIRKGSAEFNSMTFIIKKFYRAKNVRFWVKLNEVNGLKVRITS